MLRRSLGPDAYLLALIDRLKFKAHKIDFDCYVPFPGPTQKISRGCGEEIKQGERQTRIGHPSLVAMFALAVSCKQSVKRIKLESPSCRQFISLATAAQQLLIKSSQPFPSLHFADNLFRAHLPFPFNTAQVTS